MEVEQSWSAQNAMLKAKRVWPRLRGGIASLMMPSLILSLLGDTAFAVVTTQTTPILLKRVTTWQRQLV
eukprot:3330116-Amphidinium_carterae.1